MTTAMPTAIDTFPTEIAGDIARSARINNITDALEEAEKIVVGPIWYNVRAYGATGDGVTDDTANIQAAINACGAAGGGIVYIPRGRYRLTTVTASGGLSWLLYVAYDNVEIRGAGAGSILWNDSNNDNASIFFHGGHLKAARVAGNYQNWFQQQALEYGDDPATGATVYTLSGTVAKGAAAVTLATAGQASNFAAGDWVVIRTGQLLAARLGQPDGEYNRIDSISGGTLNLQWPTAKGYAQEYFVSGTTGLTSTAVTANLAKYGIANVNAKILQGPVYRDLKMAQDSKTFAVIGGYNYDGVFENITAECAGEGFLSTGAWHNQSVVNCEVRINGATANTSYWVSADTLCTDGMIVGNLVQADAVFQIHVNEGVSRLTIQNNRILLPSVSGDYHVIAVRARGYDHVIRGNVLIGGGNTSMLYADATVTGAGVVDGNVFFNQDTATYAIAVDGAGSWVIGGNATNGLSVTVASGNRIVGENPIFFTVGQMVSVAGTPTLTTTPNTSVPVWQMDDAQNDFIGCSFSVPAHWKGFDAYVHWTNMGVGSGDVSWQLQVGANSAGESMSVDRATGPSGAVAAPAQEILKVTKLNDDGAILTGNKQEQFFFLNRVGGAGGDTLGNAIGVSMVELVRVL